MDPIVVYAGWIMGAIFVVAGLLAAAHYIRNPCKEDAESCAME